MTIHKQLRLLCSGLIVTWLMGYSPAHASIELKYIGIAPLSGIAAKLKYNGASVTAGIGQIHWDARNDAGAPPLGGLFVDSPADADATADNLITFCIELGQVVNSNWFVYDKTAVADAPKPSISGNPLTGVAIGASRAAAIDRLADNFWDEATGGSLIDAVAFQLALWELVHESPMAAGGNPLPLALSVAYNAGSFYVNHSGPTGNLLTAINQANSWLGQLAANTLPNVDPFNEYTVVALTNASVQDQIIQIYTPRPPEEANLPAPEPATAIVWGLLGCGAWGVARFQRRRA